MTDKIDEIVCHSDSSNENLLVLIFSARIVTVDYYLSRPITEYDITYSEFRGCEIYQVPVLRVYGITPVGQKSCLQVHGVFPYLVIICDETMPQSESDPNFGRFIQELAISIDKALNANARSGHHHVYRISIISGISFYGYHRRSHAFLKIYFYNPYVIRRVTELLSTGAIMNKVIQPYEAHIPYILQFFIDYNLFGMNLIHISRWTFRITDERINDEDIYQHCRPSSSSEGSTGGHRIWNVAQMRNSQLCSSLRKQTCCELEIDCTADDITNRSQGQSCLGKNPGLQLLWQEECKRLGKSDSEEILPSCSNDRTNAFESDSEMNHRRRLNEMLMRYEDISSVTMTSRGMECTSANGTITLSNKSVNDTSLCDSQDNEMLNMFLSMMNDTTDNADHDSILSFQTIRNAEIDDEEAAQTLEMSQCFSYDSDIPSSHDVRSSSNVETPLQTGGRPKHPPHCSGSADDLPIIPQLDGTGDDDNLQLGMEFQCCQKINATKHSDMLLTPRNDLDAKGVSNCSPVSATQERLTPIESIIKIEIQSEEEGEEIASSTTTESSQHREGKDKIQKHHKKRHRHKSFSRRKNRKKNTDSINNGSSPLNGIMVSSSGIGNTSSRSEDLHSPQCCSSSGMEKNITKLTSKRTRARNKRCRSHSCTSESIKKEEDDMNSEELPELIRNVDMRKIGKERVMVKKLSESDIEQMLKNTKVKRKSKLSEDEEGHSNAKTKVSNLDALPSGSVTKSPSLKMKFKLKRINTRSNDSRIIVLEKEFTEGIVEPDPPTPRKLKLKYRSNSCSIEQTIDCQNFVVNDATLSKQRLQKRHLSLARKLAEIPQNQNPSYQSPVLNGAVATKRQRKSPMKTTDCNIKKRKLRSHSAVSDCEIIEVTHPADIQKERLSKLNLILTRSNNDSFNCMKSVEKLKLSNKKRSNKEAKEKSPRKMSQLSDSRPTHNQNDTIETIQGEPNSDDLVTLNQKLPKLHLKLDMKDQWTCCNTESDDEAYDVIKSKSPRKRGRRRKRSHRKTIQRGRRCSSPLKSTNSTVDQSFVENNSVSLENRREALMKLCKPFSISLKKLSDEILIKYRVVENSHYKETKSSEPDIIEDYIKPLKKVPNDVISTEELSRDSVTSQLLDDESPDSKLDKTKTHATVRIENNEKLPKILPDDVISIKELLRDSNTSQLLDDKSPDSKLDKIKICAPVRIDNNAKSPKDVSNDISTEELSRDSITNQLLGNKSPDSKLHKTKSHTPVRIENNAKSPKDVTDDVISTEELLRDSVTSQLLDDKSLDSKLDKTLTHATVRIENNEKSPKNASDDVISTEELSRDSVTNQLLYDKSPDSKSDKTKTRVPVRIENNVKSLKNITDDIISTEELSKDSITSQLLDDISPDSKLDKTKICAPVRIDNNAKSPKDVSDDIISTEELSRDSITNQLLNDKSPHSKSDKTKPYVPDLIEGDVKLPKKELHETISVEEFSVDSITNRFRHDKSLNSKLDNRKPHTPDLIEDHMKLLKEGLREIIDIEELSRDSVTSLILLDDKSSHSKSNKTKPRTFNLSEDDVKQPEEVLDEGIAIEESSRDSITSFRRFNDKNTNFKSCKTKHCTRDVMTPKELDDDDVILIEESSSDSFTTFKQLYDKSANFKSYLTKCCTRDVMKPKELDDEVIAIEESSNDSITSFRQLDDKSPNCKSNNLEACFSDTSPMPSNEDCRFRLPSFSNFQTVSQKNDDVLWNLSFFSPIEPSRHLDSPPRCWSPSSDVECIFDSQRPTSLLSNQMQIKEEPIDNVCSKDAIVFQRPTSLLSNQMQIKEEPIDNGCSKDAMVFQRPTSLLSNQMQIKEEPIDNGCSKDTIVFPADNQMKGAEKLNINNNDHPPFYDLFHNSNENEARDDAFNSENLNINIKQEILTDSSSSEKNNWYADLFGSTSLNAFSLKETENIIPSGQTNSTFPRPNSFYEIDNPTPLDSNLSSQPCNVPNSNLGEKNTMLALRKHSTESNPKNSLFHEQMSKDKICDGIKLEKDIENMNSCSASAPYPIKSEIFDIVPSTQLTFFSTLDDDDIIPLGSPLMSSKNGPNIFAIKEEKDDSCDLFGSSNDRIEASFQQRSYEYAPSLPECYRPEYPNTPKSSTSSQNSNLCAKPFDNRYDLNSTNLIDRLSANSYTESCYPIRESNTFPRTIHNSGDYLKHSKIDTGKGFPWQSNLVKDTLYSDCNNLKGEQGRGLLSNSRNHTFLNNSDPINSPLSQEQPCAFTSLNNQTVYTQNDPSPLQETEQSLSKAPDCVILKCKTGNNNLQDQKIVNTPSLGYNNIAANMWKNDAVCKEKEQYNNHANVYNNPNNIAHKTNTGSKKQTKCPQSLPSLLRAPPIIKLESPFEDGFLQPSKPLTSSIDNDDILSKLVRSCNIDSEFEFGNSYAKNPRGPEEDFMNTSKNSTPDSFFTCQSEVVTHIPNAINKAFKEQAMSFDNQHSLSFSSSLPSLPQTTGAALLVPCKSDGSMSSAEYNSLHFESSSKSLEKEDYNSSFISTFDEIHSFYGNETINQSESSFEILNPALSPAIAVPSNIQPSKSEKLSKKKSKPAARNKVATNMLLTISPTVAPKTASSIKHGSTSSKDQELPPKTLFDKSATRDQITRSKHTFKHQEPFYSDPADQPPQHSVASHSASTNQRAALAFERSFQRLSPTNFKSEEVKNNLLFHVFLSEGNSKILIPSNCAPSVFDIKRFINKKVPSETLIDCTANKSVKETDSSAMDQKESVMNTPHIGRASKYSTLTKLLESPIASDSLFSRTGHSLSPAFSTPLGLKSDNSNKKQVLDSGGIQEESIYSTPEQTFLTSHPISHTTRLSSSIRKRKLDFSEAATSVASKAVRVERQKPQFLLANNSLNSTSSQIEGPTLENSGAFKVNLGNTDSSSKSHEFQYLTIMSIEVHVNTRNNLCPDPEHDPVSMVFFCVSRDDERHENKVGVIAVDDDVLDQAGSHKSTNLKQELQATPGVLQDLVFCVNNEKQLFEKVKAVVRAFDPEILLGYEIQKLSLGYLCKRATYLNMNFKAMLSRLLDEDKCGESTSNRDFEADTDSDQSSLHVTGRIILNLWRIMRKEVTLNIYTFENVYYHVMRQRIPLFSFETLTKWYCNRQQLLRFKVLQYYVRRVTGNVQLMEKLDVIQSTSELARVFGIQFYEVLSRGSQFRVESMMLRYAKPLQYIPISPSIQQRSMSRAPECVPLIFEPESKFYADPVVVLDFQSLYPSMMIAYNYCFSTCLGRVENFCKTLPFEFGCASLSVPPDLLLELGDSIHIAPTGVAFVKSDVRQGILPSMLSDILNTRILVKKSLKLHKDNKFLSRLLEARQLGLKLIANVTYGYTSANFSGRMPCVEIADSIVSKGRETLERAIHVIESSDTWKAKVVYGDTDSVFILLAGRTRAQAFEIGQEIADVITAMNPKPVKLKFEKAYHPCVLQSKKRYVGYMYETIDQVEPIFDAKGIETVRRDSCAAVGKMLEKSLKILFNTKDISLVKKYVQKQFGKILSGRTSMTDYIFAKEFRGSSGYRPGACVPALEIAKKRLLKDCHSVPLTGERVPYVVVYGFPGLPVIQLVREPGELLDDSSLRINAKYYITRVISPPLDRVLSLIGADVKQWYEGVSRIHVPALPMVPVSNRPRSTLSQYFTTLSCPSCEKPTNFGLCASCQQDRQATAIVLNSRIREWERSYHQLNKICTSCVNDRNGDELCMSLDCPVLYRRSQARRDLAQAPYVRNILLHELF